MFRLCKDLGVDDPVAWFNAAPPDVVHGWMAYYAIEADAANGKKPMVGPGEAQQALMRSHG